MMSVASHVDLSILLGADECCQFIDVLDGALLLTLSDVLIQ